MNRVQQLFKTIKNQCSYIFQPLLQPPNTSASPHQQTVADSGMRLTRSKPRKRPAGDPINLDSNEFEDASGAAEETAPRRSKRRRADSQDVAAEAPTQRDRAARAATQAAGVLSHGADITDEDEDLDELEELEEVSEQQLEADDDAVDSDYDAKTSEQPTVKKVKAAEKKPRKKRKSTRRLCVTYAKAQYGLTDRDLAQLTDVKYEENPHYPGGHPMRLYLVRELEELAKKKQEQKALLASTAEERALERAAVARAKRAAAAEAAAATVKAIGAKSLKPCDEKHGSVRLPDTCLAKVMTCIAATLEPGGLRGPSCVARELANAALVCWDFYHAAKTGFISLAEATSTLQQTAPVDPSMVCAPRSDAYAKAKLLHGLGNLPGPASLGGWPFWDSLLQDPTTLRLPELKDAAKLLGVPVTGTKPELMLRILGGFGTQAPTTAPAQLLRALVWERANLYCFWDGPGYNILAALHKLQLARHPAADGHVDMQRAKGVAGIRAHLLQHFSTTDEMVAVALAAHNAWRDQQAAEAAEREAARRKRAAEWAAQRAALQAAAVNYAPRHTQPMFGGGQQHVGPTCGCGNPAAQACTRACCAKCCRQLAAGAGAARCVRHST